MTSANIRLGSYDILGNIGHGNFSICKLGQHRVTRQKVAIKCIEKRNLDTTHLTRIYREIEIMKSLQHPNIIKLNQVVLRALCLFVKRFSLKITNI